MVKLKLIIIIIVVVLVVLFLSFFYIQHISKPVQPPPTNITEIEKLGDAIKAAILQALKKV